MHLGATQGFIDNVAVASMPAHAAGLATGTTVMTLNGEKPLNI
jgi:hypothetical protein